MARQINRLDALKVKSLTKAGRHGDGGGLYLSISKEGRRRWIFLFTWNGKLREAGLGSANKGGVSLKDAREKAAEGRKLVKDGIDPIAYWNKAEAGVTPTFGDVADEYISAHEGSWRNDKHAAQWKMTLKDYCETMRKLPVDRVDTDAVFSTLKPLWRRAPETASRLRGRIEAVLDAAKAKGHIGRNEANPAQWRGHLDKLLPRPSKLTRGHHAAMPYAEVPSFIAQIKEREATAARALEFCILTTTRTSETLNARWSEIDLTAKVWTIPGERMKAGREHRVPLSARAVEILKAMKEAEGKGYVFPGRLKDRPLSNMAFEMFLRRCGSNYTTHGFRSSFRDWAGNETRFPRELAEHALAHVIGDKAEQAYRRSDALERRRELMDAWALYCEGEAGANVVALKRTA
jgi:integrase